MGFNMSLSEWNEPASFNQKKVENLMGTSH